MKKISSVFLILFLCATLVTGVVTGTTIKDDMTFEGPVSFLNTLGFRGITYTLPAADGTAGQQLTTDGAGVWSWAAAGGTATAWDDIGNPDANSSLSFANYTNVFTGTLTNGISHLFENTGNMTTGGILVDIEQKTGNPDGNAIVLQVKAADSDPKLLSLNNGAEVLYITGAGVITGGAAAIDYTDFDVSADGLITLAPDLGGTGITITPSAALTTGLDVSNAQITNGVSLGATKLLGTTAVIDFTNFDVDNAGNIITAGNMTAVDGTFSGNVNVTGTFQQDSITAATAATTLTVDGTGVGGVTVGGTSTGVVTLGGGATSVNLPATVDLTLSGGDLTVIDTANTDTVTFTNNAMTTADLLTLNAGGTRTSDNVIEIVDAATTASTIGITANTQTAGNGISYTNTGAGLTGAGLYMAITDGAGFTGDYINCTDAGTSDFRVARYGAATIAGNASTNMLTITTGDFQIDDGLFEVDTDEDDMSYIKRNQGATTKPAFKVWEAAAAADSPAIQIIQDATTAASYGLEIDSAGGTSVHLAANGAAGDQILIDATDASTGQFFKIDAGPWLGTLGEGAGFDFRSDSAATAEAGQVIYIKMQGTAADAASIDGKGLYIEDEAGATAGSYLAKLDTKSNTALHISNSGAAADGIKFDVADSYTGQGIVADLGPWLGTSGEGFISLISDNAATVPAGQFMRFRQLGTGQHAAAIAGSLVYLEDDAAAPAAGTSYIMNIDATNIEAIHVDTGKVLVDETVTATGGVSTGNAADSFIMVDTVECNNACIKGLRAGPKELVATPGANKFIEVINAVLIMDYGTNVLTANAGDDLVIQYNTSGQDITGSIETTGFLTAAADTMAFVNAAGIATSPAANISNKAVELFNIGGAEIAGNAGNDTTMTIKISYRIHADGL
jgi:hypothetical protein